MKVRTFCFFLLLSTGTIVKAQSFTIKDHVFNVQGVDQFDSVSLKLTYHKTEEGIEFDYADVEYYAPWAYVESPYVKLTKWHLVFSSNWRMGLMEVEGLDVPSPKDHVAHLIHVDRNEHDTNTITWVGDWPLFAAFKYRREDDGVIFGDIGLNETVRLLKKHTLYLTEDMAETRGWAVYLAREGIGLVQRGTLRDEIKSLWDELLRRYKPSEDDLVRQGIILPSEENVTTAVTPKGKTATTWGKLKTSR